MTRRLRARLLVAGGIVLVALNLRPSLIVISPLLADIQVDLGMTPAAAGLLGALPPLAFAVFGWLAPAVAGRIGYERLAWTAMLVTAAAQGARLLTDQAPVFLLVSAVAYAGMGVGNVLLPPLVKLHFPRRMGLVTGIYILVLSVGTALPALMAVPVAELGGWRFSAGVWAVVALAAVCPWVVTDAAVRNADRRPRSEQRPAYVPTRALLLSPLAWSLVGIFGINSLNAYAMFAWLPSLLVDAGTTPSAAGAYLSLFAVVALPLALVVPWLTIRVANPLLLIVGFAGCYAAGYAGLLLAPGAGTAIWVVLAGVGPGAFPMALTLVNLRSRTVGGAAALAGFTQGIGYAIAGLGPFVVGLLREIRGDWAVPLGFLIATLAVQVAAGVVVSRPGTIEDQLRWRGRRLDT